MDEAQNIDDARPKPDISNDLIDVARLAYIYGFPPYEMMRLRLQALRQPGRRPNTLLHARRLTTPTTGRVTNTNADMLKSTAWLELSGGPFVIHLPETANRYYSLALIDVFTNNFAVLGPRTTGGSAADFFLAGPWWSGTAAAGMTAIRASTNVVWALLRILIDGADDLPAVHALQNQFSITTLSGESFKTALPGPAHHSRPLSLASDKTLAFFDVLNTVLTENPPLPQDKPILDRLRHIGIGPSLHFNRSDFTPQQFHALRRGLALASDAIQNQAGGGFPGPQRIGQKLCPSDALLGLLRGSNVVAQTLMHFTRAGWSYPSPKVGNFGADYLLRARCALRGIGGLPCEEAMYFIAATDAADAALDGRYRYYLRFPPGGEPPVDAYWSLTPYWIDENKRRWLVPNETNRFSIGSHNPDRRYDADGSLEISIQRNRPAVSDGNWLPAPDGRFVLNLRAYRPRLQLLQGHYEIPAVRRRSLFE